MDNPGNDVIIRVTKGQDGIYSHEVLIGVSDESMLPELHKTAQFINNALAVKAKTDAEVEYSKEIEFADSLAKPKLIIAR